MIHENNIELSDSERKRLQDNDLSQKEVVLQILSWSTKPLTDAEIRDSAIKEGLVHPNTPLTSIRRARSNLKREGKVIEGNSKRDGGYGVETKTWRLTSKKERQSDLFGKPQAKNRNGVVL